MNCLNSFKLSMVTEHVEFSLVVFPEDFTVVIVLSYHILKISLRFVSLLIPHHILLLLWRRCR
jgi:hypothetical protein